MTDNVNIRTISLVFTSLLLFSCGSDEVEKYQGNRDNVENVKEQVSIIDIGDNILMGQGTRLSVMDNYLEFSDYSSPGKMIHLFDKSSMLYVASIGDLGQGPGEIISLGEVILNDKKNKIYVSDLGHQCVYSYDIDSLIRDKDYKPYIKYRMKRDMIPTYYYYISDTLCYATFIHFIDSKTRKRVSGKWNMMTGDVRLMGYEQPDVINRQPNFTFSIKQNLFVEYHGRADLISIFDGDFKLLHNVYGPDWNDGDDKRLNFFPAVICNNYIIAAYEGSLYREMKLPTKLHVFKLNGDYIKTLETGRRIHFMSADEDNNRLFLSFDDEIQFGYLDLKGILD